MTKREFEEIEVALDEKSPVSKKQKRLLKKKGIKVEDVKDTHEKTAPVTPKKSEFGVWIGNLYFETTEKDLREFLSEKTDGKISKDTITRVKLVAKKGFAYVDLNTKENMDAVIQLSESRLGGRNLLIKNANSFEGRPAKTETQEQKNPPSRVLFVGNLTFDTTDDQLRMHFQHCGEIVKIRTATFQDTGKCKGFTFIDFIDIESATKALNDKRCRRLNGRTLRQEYGEDRSKRRPKIAPTASEREEQAVYTPRESESTNTQTNHDNEATIYKPRRTDQEHAKPKRTSKPQRKERPTPGAALSNAVRANESVVPSTGKKVVFD